MTKLTELTELDSANNFCHSTAELYIGVTGSTHSVLWATSIALLSSSTSPLMDAICNLSENGQISTPQLTMNVYARARDERLSELVEKVGKTVLRTECVPYVCHAS